MPYINSDRRFAIDEGSQPRTSGELNYLITVAIVNYLKNAQLITYQTMNDIVGALDNAKDEFRRRIQHPYENAKMQENGDVY